VKPATKDNIVVNLGSRGEHPTIKIHREQSRDISLNTSPHCLMSKMSSTDLRHPLKKLPSIYIGEDQSSFRSKDDVRSFTDGGLSDVEQSQLFYHTIKPPSSHIRDDEGQCTLHSESSAAKTSDQEEPSPINAPLTAGESNLMPLQGREAALRPDPSLSQSIVSSGNSSYSTAPDSLCLSQLYPKTSSIGIQTDSECSFKKESMPFVSSCSSKEDPMDRNTTLYVANDYWDFTRSVTKKMSLSLSEPSSKQVNRSRTGSAQSYNMDELDSLLSTNLLKDCYSAVGKANCHSNDVKLSDSLMKIIQQGDQKQSAPVNLKASKPKLSTRRSSSLPSLGNMNKDETSSTISSSSIQHARSVDLNFGEPSGPSINFNSFAKQLREAKVLPSQLHAKKLEIKQLLREQRERRQVNKITEMQILNISIKI